MTAIVTAITDALTALGPNVLTVGAGLAGLVVVIMGVRKVIGLVRRG